MNRVNDISDELKAMGDPLAGMGKGMPYGLPEGYFEQFPGSLQQTMKLLNEADAAPGWEKGMPFEVPAGYFDTLPGDILAHARMAGQSKEMPFGLPDGYFDALPGKVLDATRKDDKPKTRIIPLGGSTLFRQLRWVAAAVVIMGISIGSYRTLFTSTHEPESADQILAAIPSNELKDYVQGTYRIDVDQIENSTDVTALQLDNKEIVEYLNETGWD